MTNQLISFGEPCFHVSLTSTVPSGFLLMAL